MGGRRNTLVRNVKSVQHFSREIKKKLDIRRLGRKDNIEI
jgi:hypothetical protein